MINRYCNGFLEGYLKELNESIFAHKMNEVRPVPLELILSP